MPKEKAPRSVSNDRVLRRRTRTVDEWLEPSDLDSEGADREDVDDKEEDVDD